MILFERFLHGLIFEYLIKFHGQDYVTNKILKYLLYVNPRVLMNSFFGGNMNSVERKQARYERRKNKRLRIIEERSSKYADLNNAFCFSKAIYYGDKCCNGVGYKKSTQNFKLHEFTIISNICRDIKTSNYKVGDTYSFIINERGKVRKIDAPHIKDRVVHKILSNEIIEPLYTPHLIYDNGASLKNKGFKFSMDRLKKKLYSWYLKNGLNGYIVLIDFSKFFENCSHEVIHNIHLKYIENEEVIKAIEDYLFIGEGIALGVEIAQREAVIIPNVLDHFIQNKTNIIRYMDDSIFLMKNYKEAEKLLNEYRNLANIYKIKLNNKKSLIVPISKCFTYCKWKYNILDNGKIIIKPHKSTVKRQKNKLKKMIKLKLSIEEINQTKNSFISYLSLSNVFNEINH